MPRPLAPAAQPATLTLTREDAAAFRRAPYGPHGPALQRVVNILRGPPAAGKYVLVCTKPHREWVLGRLPGAPDKPVEVLAEPVFTDLAAAEWAVFKLRWQARTGEVLEDV